MNGRTLRSLIVGLAVLGIMTLAIPSAQAGWYHWRGHCAPWGGYGGWGSYGGWGGHGTWGGYGYSGWNDYGYAGWGNTAYAGWGGYGYTGGCYAPYGSAYRPAYQPYYSHRCVGPVRRLLYRLCTHHYAYYGGGCGSWCGSYAACVSCCPTCWYDPCCGDGYYEAAPQETPPAPPHEAGPDGGMPTPAGDQPARPAPPVPNPAGDSQPGSEQSSIGPTDALLTVRVPAEAKVFVNGAPTRSKGTVRRYVSRNLRPGFNYAYKLQVVTAGEGQPGVQTRTVHVQAGQSRQLAFAPGQRLTNPETILTLHVPADAQVSLAGNQMQGDGPVRTFRTRKMSQGEQWPDYQVRVTLQRDGQTLSRTKNIAVVAGQQHDLQFDFNLDKVALAR